MVAKEFIDYFTEFNVLRAVGVEDAADRLNSLFTMVILLICVLIVGVKQYVLSPIACYATTGLKADQFMDYMTTYCWTHGTIPLTENETKHQFPNNGDWEKLDRERRITYYQWVPFVLCLQALMFHLPRLIWSVVCRNMAGTDTENLISLADQASKEEGPSRKKIIIHIAGILELILQDRRREPSNRFSQLILNSYQRLVNCCCRGSNSDLDDTGHSPVQRFGSVIRLQYVIVKLVYLGNILAQIFLTQHFLGFTHYLFGYTVLSSLIAGEDWQYTNWFPRVAYCNANNIAVMGDAKQRHIAQCCLPLNMLNEKIYIFLWFWFVLLLFVTWFSLMSWLFRICYQPSQDAFINKLLRMLQKPVTKEDLDRADRSSIWHLFTRRYLRSDGVFLLLMIESNAGDLVVSEVVKHLWKTYREKKFLEEDRAIVTRHNIALPLTDEHPLRQRECDKETFDKKMVPTAPPPDIGFYPSLSPKATPQYDDYRTAKV